MILKLAVVIAAVVQVVAAATISMAAFTETDRAMMVFIQPASWAFSIWGLIFAFSFVYAIYQLIPSNDNATLRATRVPALVGFLGATAWLYTASAEDWLVWLTAPVLLLMAYVFTRVVLAPDADDAKSTFLSKQILYPYAAWTGIAAWLNIQTLLSDQMIVTTDTINIITNLVLFVCIATFTFYCYKKTNYSLWYGGVLVWAGIAVVAANLNGGMTLFAVLGGLFALMAAGQYVIKRLR